MSPEHALNELKVLISANTPLPEALERFINFYSNTNIEGCPKDDEGDMLLFQWGGPYSWDESYSINLTRQFTFLDSDGEYEGMQQLQMNCRYNPEQIAIKSGNEWFEGENLDEFRQSVLSSDSVKLASTLEMRSIALELGDV